MVKSDLVKIKDKLNYYRVLWSAPNKSKEIVGNERELRMADIDECCFPVRLIIIMINIMAEKSHPGHRPRYIEFRF